MKEPENYCFCLIFVYFFLTLSNKRNKVSGDHDRRTQGGDRVGARQGGGSMNKKIPCGGGWSFPYFFYVGSLFSPRGGHFFRGGGGLFFCKGGGGVIIGLALHNNFCGSLLLLHFYCTDIYNLSRSWRFEFLEGAILSTQKTCPHPSTN